MKILIKDKRHLVAAARRLLSYTGDKKILAFYGSMGAGKTTFIKTLCMVLGTGDIVSSPTFTLVNEYRTTGGETIYHLDFYRIRNTNEVFDFGIEEYLESGSYCFMEWPELIEDILPHGTVRIRISAGADNKRTLDVSL